MRTTLLLPLAVAMALAIPAEADHCEVDHADPELETPATGVSLSAAEVGGANPGIYYVDTSVCQPECLFDVWIYEETNGHAGLQRGDEFADEGCQFLVPDTIIF